MVSDIPAGDGNIEKLFLRCKLPPAFSDGTLESLHGKKMEENDICKKRLFTCSKNFFVFAYWSGIRLSLQKELI